MSDESFKPTTIRRAPNGKFYVYRYGKAICLANGNPRYFETEHEAWAFLTDCDAAEVERFAA